QLHVTIKPSPPEILRINSPSDFKLPAGDKIVKITYDMSVENAFSTKFIQLMGVPLAQSMINAFSQGGAPAAAPAAPASGQQMPGMMPGMGQPGMMPGMAPIQQQFSTQPAVFSEFDTAGMDPKQQGNIGLLMDVPMTLTVELGRTEKLVKEILTLGEGSIIELDKLAGEPVDLLVNGKLIAKGEVVVIEENFGVRVTDIVSPMDRMASLQ
ncbi:MAG: flagellar motor switch protein FliN, partial [Actinomycetia bacterium]|nr:flagellar motor switch protein FliN [Actinomycetes bacterium]